MADPQGEDRSGDPPKTYPSSSRNLGVTSGLSFLAVQAVPFRGGEAAAAALRQPHFEG